MDSPLFTKSRAVNLPMPVFDPVTTAVFPSSRTLLLYLEQDTIAGIRWHTDRWKNTVALVTRQISSSWKHLPLSLSPPPSLSFSLFLSYYTLQHRLQISHHSVDRRVPYPNCSVKYQWLLVKSCPQNLWARIYWFCVEDIEFCAVIRNWLTWVKTRSFYVPGNKF